jgi:acyl-CoA thioester hydrolase
MDRPTPLPASAFTHFAGITTRWIDNDVYGHVNNVVYYEFFDTVVNGYLIAQGALDIANGTVIGLVVETHCNYFKPVAFPDTLRAGLRVAKLGTSSVRYEVGIFRNDDDTAAAQGHFVHVYVDRATNKPVPLPAALKQALGKLVK